MEEKEGFPISPSLFASPRRVLAINGDPINQRAKKILGNYDEMQSFISDFIYISSQERPEILHNFPKRRLDVSYRGVGPFSTTLQPDVRVRPIEPQKKVPASLPKIQTVKREGRMGDRSVTSNTTPKCHSDTKPCRVDKDTKQTIAVQQQKPPSPQKRMFSTSHCQLNTKAPLLKPEPGSYKTHMMRLKPTQLSESDKLAHSNKVKDEPKSTSDRNLFSDNFDEKITTNEESCKSENFSPKDWIMEGLTVGPQMVEEVLNEIFKKMIVKAALEPPISPIQSPNNYPHSVQHNSDVITSVSVENIFSEMILNYKLLSPIPSPLPRDAEEANIKPTVPGSRLDTCLIDTSLTDISQKAEPTVNTRGTIENLASYDSKNVPVILDETGSLDDILGDISSSDDEGISKFALKKSLPLPICNSQVLHGDGKHLGTNQTDYQVEICSQRQEKTIEVEKSIPVGKDLTICFSSKEIRKSSPKNLSLPKSSLFTTKKTNGNLSPIKQVLNTSIIQAKEKCEVIGRYVACTLPAEAPKRIAHVPKASTLTGQKNTDALVNRLQQLHDKQIITSVTKLQPPATALNSRSKIKTKPKLYPPKPQQIAVRPIPSQCQLLKVPVSKSPKSSPPPDNSLPRKPIKVEPYHFKESSNQSPKKEPNLTPPTIVEVSTTDVGGYFSPGLLTLKVSPFELSPVKYSIPSPIDCSPVLHRKKIMINIPLNLLDNKMQTEMKSKFGRNPKHKRHLVEPKWQNKSFTVKINTNLLDKIPESRKRKDLDNFKKSPCYLKSRTKRDEEKDISYCKKPRISLEHSDNEKAILNSSRKASQDVDKLLLDDSNTYNARAKYLKDQAKIMKPAAQMFLNLMSATWYIMCGYLMETEERPHNSVLKLFQGMFQFLEQVGHFDDTRMEAIKLLLQTVVARKTFILKHSKIQQLKSDLNIESKSLFGVGFPSSQFDEYLQQRRSKSKNGTHYSVNVSDRWLSLNSEYVQITELLLKSNNFWAESQKFMKEKKDFFSLLEVKRKHLALDSDIPSVVDFVKDCLELLQPKELKIYTEAQKHIGSDRSFI